MTERLDITAKRDIRNVIGEEEARIVEGMSLNDYLALPHISGSSIIKDGRSLMAVKWHYEHNNATTDAMRFGCCVDHLLFEYGIPAAMERRKLDAEEFLADWPLIEGQRRGKDWLNPAERPAKQCPTHREYGVQYVKDAAELEEITRIATAVCNDPVAAEHWRQGRPQLTILMTIEGIRVKMRPDWVGADIDDLKTTNNVEDRRLTSNAWDFRYPDKMALYRRGYLDAAGEQKGCNLIYVQSVDEPDVVVLPIPEVTLSLCEEKMVDACARIRRAIETDHWPGVANGKVADPLPTPPWVMDELEFQEVA